MPHKSRYLGIALIILGLAWFAVKYYLPFLSSTVIDAFLIVVLGVVLFVLSFRVRHLKKIE